MNDTKMLKMFLCAVVALTVTSTSSFAAEFFLRADVTTKDMPGEPNIPMWGFARDSAFGANDGTVTVPGPLLVVPTGDSNLTIHLDNNLPVPVSIVINGQIAPMTPVKFTDAQGRQRIRSFTHETDPNNAAAVDYVWTNLQPGTYAYQSGTHPAVQVQMGLYGGLIKDYAATPYKQAYPLAIYDVNVPLFFSEIDPALHAAVDANDYGPGKSMTSTIDYEPKYFLINGEAFTSGQPLLPAGASGGGTLLRLFNMGLQSRSVLLQGGHMTLIAEDGQPYSYPREQYAALLPAGKTIDAMVAFPSAGAYPVYDRRLGLTNAAATGGGMLRQLQVTAGNFWPVIASVTATPASIFDFQTTQLLATATDTDGPSPLTYAWEVPPGVGTLDDATIPNPVFTPAFVNASQTYTLTVTVSDGAHVDIATVEVTVKPTPSLVSIEISGPVTVEENTTAQYTVLAQFSDGSSSSVQPQAWSVDVAQASIDAAGLLTAAAVDADTPAVVSAEYTFNGTTATDTHNITILNAAVPPSEVIVDNRDAGTSWTGTWPVSAVGGFWATDSVYATVIGNRFTWTASLVPGTTYQVYAWWTAAPSRYTATPYEVMSGTTLLGTVPVNQEINGGQWNLLGTYSFTDATASVTVVAVVGGSTSTSADAVRFVPVMAENLVGLEIIGPATVDENTAVQYTALAHFSNGSSLPVQPQTWSVDAAQTTINATGLLTAASVDADTPAVIWAEYTLNGTTVTDTHNITILNSGALPPEVIVDNQAAGTSSTGRWRVSGVGGFWATDSVFANVIGNRFTWTAALVPGTTYQVYAWWTAAPSRYTATPYEVRNGVTLLATVPVNQEINGGQWNLLGTYTFTDTAASVSVVAVVGGATSTSADAVRFVPVP